MKTYYIVKETQNRGFQMFYPKETMNVHDGAGEMAQWLRALAALPEFRVQVPATTWWLTTICNGDLMPSSGMQVYMQTEHSYIKKCYGNR